jgi:hypothetical protein
MVLSAEEALEAFTAAGYPPYWVRGHGSWRSALSEAEGPTDRDRLRALKKAGLAEAAEMLLKEITAPDGYGA